MALLKSRVPRRSFLGLLRKKPATAGCKAHRSTPALKESLRENILQSLAVACSFCICFSARIVGPLHLCPSNGLSPMYDAKRWNRKQFGLCKSFPCLGFYRLRSKTEELVWLDLFRNSNLQFLKQVLLDKQISETMARLHLWQTSLWLSAWGFCLLYL